MRRNSDYPAERSIRDALALITALREDPGGEGIAREALRSALDGTNHTELVYDLATLTNLFAGLAAKAEGVPVDEVIQRVAAAANLAIETIDDE